MENLITYTPMSMVSDSLINSSSVKLFSWIDSFRHSSMKLFAWRFGKISLVLLPFASNFLLELDWYSLILFWMILIPGHSKLGQEFKVVLSIYTIKHTLLANDLALDVLISSNFWYFDSRKIAGTCNHGWRISFPATCIILLKKFVNFTAQECELLTH